jgi:sugar/nucleoside kinase (ribokinase family)
MAGGTSFYFSNAIRHMDVKYRLVTGLAESEMNTVAALREKGIEVDVVPSRHTVYFENIYSENQDHRTQRVLQKADPFSIEALSHTDACIFHLGPLLADDIPVEVIKSLSERGKVALDVQGYLRKVENHNVHAIDWPAKQDALKYIHTLKANESEMEVLTGLSDVRKGAKVLAEWGVKEVVITLGSMGSVIYANGVFHYIPAYVPTAVIDATGCGDTYMAGYLYQRTKGASFQDAGEFAAAMATLKIESSGPFTGTKQDVQDLLAASREKIFAAL